MMTPFFTAHPSRLLARLALWLALGAFAASTATAAEAAPKAFDLPADNAAKTLRLFSEQAGVPVVFGTDTAALVRTHAVKGTLPPMAALTQMLADTGLVVATNEKTGALMVSRSPNAPRAVVAPSPVRPKIKSPLAEEALVLSPFVVATTSDVGYAATETLAGTRMRTSLKDVGASLTVLTPEFLQDLGVNSLDQALLYTPSVDTVDGDNSSGARANGNSLRFGTGQAYSIRGFVSNTGDQAISHDFFAALDSSDNYNLERITLALGPNSLLIGVGNPQGVAVTTTKRAQVQATKTTVQMQTDTNESRRASLDHNQPLIKGKLALRLNLLGDQKREFRAYEGKDQARVTLGITAKPFANTTVTVNHENYTVNVNTSTLVWGFDGAALRWAQAGRPAVNFVPNGQAWTAAGRTFVDAAGNRIPVAAGANDVNRDGFVNSQLEFDPRTSLSQITAQNQTYVVGLNGLTSPLVNFRYQGQLLPGTFGFQGSNAYQSGKNPWELLGLNREANLSGGTWDDPGIQNHGRWSQVIVEQRLATGLHLEFAGHVADDKRDQDPTPFNDVTIDPNRYLPNGSLNPGYLVPYAETAGGQYRHTHVRSAEYRATLSYQLDLTKKNRWLGSHNVSSLYQTSRRDTDSDVVRLYNTATVGRAGWNADTINLVNTIGARAYFVNGNVPALPDTNQILKYASALNGTTLLGATAAEQAPVNLTLQSGQLPQKSRFTTDSLSLGWQGRWLADRLITLVGYRRDDTASYGPVTTGTREVALPEIAGSTTTESRRYFTPSQDIAINPVPGNEAVGISRTYGAVLHALPWLTLSYNQSGNFNPVGNASVKTALGVPAPNSTGTTNEYKVLFSLPDGKFSVGLTKFQTRANDQARNANGYTGGLRNILTRLRLNYAGDSHFAGLAPAGGYPVELNTVQDTFSFVAEGYEMNVVYNPSRNWRMALSGSSNTNVQGENLASLGAYLYMDSPYQGLGTWRKFAAELSKVAAGTRSASFDLDPANPAHRSLAAVDALYFTQQADAQETVYRNSQLLRGITTNRNGKYAVNGLITRVFNEGRLKGWSVGTNFRWRSEPVVGYESIRNTATGLPTSLFDVSKPLDGKSQLEIGALLSYQRRVAKTINLRVQLNIQNLPNWTDPRLVRMDYDTSGYKGPANEIVPVLWELRRPRNFVLTTTFDF